MSEGQDRDEAFDGYREFDPLAGEVKVPMGFVAYPRAGMGGEPGARVILMVGDFLSGAMSMMVSGVASFRCFTALPDLKLFAVWGLVLSLVWFSGSVAILFRGKWGHGTVLAAFLVLSGWFVLMFMVREPAGGSLFIWEDLLVVLVAIPALYGFYRIWGWDRLAGLVGGGR